jgi:hypothetical protein
MEYSLTLYTQISRLLEKLEVNSLFVFLFHSFPCSVLHIFVCLYVLFLKVIVLSVRRFTVSDYSFGILKLLAITLFVLWLTLSDYPLVSWKFWSLHCLFFDLRFLITLWYLESFDHYIVWSLIYAFWLPFGIFKRFLILRVLTITLYDLWFRLSDYPLVSWKFWPLLCLIFDVRFLITLWYLRTFLRSRCQRTSS